MNRASPANMRKAMEMAQVLMKAGVLFVPMPVLNDRDAEILLAMTDQRLEILAQQAEESQ